MALLLLLLACDPAAEEQQPPPPPLLAAEPVLPAPQRTLTVTRTADGLAVDGRPCPGAPSWQAGDVAVVCIDPAEVDAAGAHARIAAAGGAVQVALYPSPALQWPLWFLGAELTLTPSDAPLRDESGGALRLGVTEAMTIERSAGWLRAGGGWLRDDLPLGDSLLLLPYGAAEKTFQLDHPEVIWKLAAEVGPGAGAATLNGGSLTDTPPIRAGALHTLYNPPLSLLRRGENGVGGGRAVGLSGHIGAAVPLDWRHGAPADGWQELRFADGGWAPGDGGRCRRARLTAPDAAAGTQVWLDGPGRVWLNGAEILALDTAGRGQVPPGAWMPGDNLLAVEAAPGVRAALWRY